MNSSRPKALAVIPENIPPDVTSRCRWVGWRWWHDAQKDKWTKPPYQPDGATLARTDSPQSWKRFADILASYRTSRLDGVGFVIASGENTKPPTEPHGITAVDLDHCVDRISKIISPWALEIIEDLQSYTELSPSGEGIRILLYGQMPNGDGKRKNGNVEIFSRVGYVTLTGQRLENFCAAIESRQAQLNRIYEKFFPEKAKPEPRTTAANGWDPTDDGLLEKAFRARNGAKLKRIYEGNVGDYGTPSEGDLALCRLLAFWASDEAQLDRLFRRSGLMRPKWDARHGARTYGEMTISKAWVSTIEHFAYKTIKEPAVLATGSFNSSAGPR